MGSTESTTNGFSMPSIRRPLWKSLCKVRLSGEALVPPTPVSSTPGTKDPPTSSLGRLQQSIRKAVSPSSAIRTLFKREDADSDSDDNNEDSEDASSPGDLEYKPRARDRIGRQLLPRRVLRKRGQNLLAHEGADQGEEADNNPDMSLPESPLKTPRPPTPRSSYTVLYLY